LHIQPLIHRRRARPPFSTEALKLAATSTDSPEEIRARLAVADLRFDELRRRHPELSTEAIGRQLCAEFAVAAGPVLQAVREGLSPLDAASPLKAGLARG
jgi:hypothetical protein